MNNQIDLINLGELHMKRINALVAVGFALGCSTVQAGQITLKNPGFEGDNVNCAPGLLGCWATIISSGNGSVNGIGNPAVVTSHTSVKNPPDGDPSPPLVAYSPYSPTESTHFLMIGSGSAADNVWQKVTQQFTVNAIGDSLSGYAAFDWDDADPQLDGARVRIFGLNYDSENILPRIFSLTGASFPDDYYNGPWTLWSWIAPAAGTYTLEYAVANTNSASPSNRNNSYGYFDTVPATVPEPATLALFVIGLASLSSMQQRRRSTSLK